MERLRHNKKIRFSHFLKQNEHSLLVFSTYFLLLLSRFIDTGMIDRENEYLSIVLLQILIFLIPALLFCKVKGNKFTERLRFRLPSPSHILLLVAAFFMLICGCLLLAIQTGGVASLSHNFSLYDTFLSKNSGTVSDVLYLLLAYAALPAICEELVFRGILCATLESRGIVCTVVYSALSFGMLHFQIDQLPSYIFAGILLCLCLYATRSLLSTILLHFAYNVFCLFGQPALTRFYLYTGSAQLFKFSLTFVLLLSTIFFFGEASRIYQNYANTGEQAAYRVNLSREQFPILFVRTLLSPVGILSVIFYILVCIFEL